MRLSFFWLLLMSILLSQSHSSKEPYDEICDDEPPTKRLKSACYFSVPRTTPLEHGSRDARFKVSTSCDGTLHSMIALARNDEGRLFGAPHELALVTSGGEGLFLHDNSDLSQFDGEVICEKHLNELSRHFMRNHNPRLSKQRESGSKCATCAYPEVHSAKATRTMPYQKSYHLLLSENILVPPGTPLCARHYNGLPNEPPTTTTPSSQISDYAIPDPPLSSGDWGVNDFTYAQGPIPGGSVSGSEGEADDSDDSCYEANDGSDPKSKMKSFFKQYLKEAKIKRGFCNKKYGDLTEKYQKDKQRTLRKIVKAVIGTIVESEEDQELLFIHFTELLKGKNANDEDTIFHALMTGVADDFKHLKKYSEKLQLLSIFAPHVKYSVMYRFIPNLAERMYTEAKKKGLDPVKKAPDTSKRERYSHLKLHYFISFVTSPLAIVGIPWGEQKTKDSTGKTITLPNTIRLMGIYEIIETYETWMRQNGREHLILSNSTTYKILSKMPALRSSSKTCVDYFQASATMAFILMRERLKDLQDMNLLDASEVATFKHIFDEIEVYLRTDFKLHVKEESHISDHCMNHGLSDPGDARFASAPRTPHDHDWKCPSCEKMDYIFRDIKKKVQTMVDESTSETEMKLLDIQHDFEVSIDKILDLKAHHVRTVFTSLERDVLIRGLQEGEAFITLDFAQKWLPSFYRETQKDFFGKPGYSWHLSHVYANVSGELVQHVYTHIFHNEIQNGSIVVEVIKHMSEDLAKMGITKLHLRSDNAGYYHSAPVMATIPAIAAKFSITIASWSFSEAQSGKSSSDRYCAYCKTIMRTYMAKGKNIDTQEQMFVALTEGKGLRGMSVHLGTVQFTPQPKTTINGISNLGHFEFNGDTISAWRFRGIGKGMSVKGLKGIDSSIVFDKHGGKLSSGGVDDAKKIRNGEQPHFWFFPAKHTAPEPGNADDEAVTGEVPVFDPSSASPLFVCNQCKARFIRHDRLLRHIENGRHKIRPEKVSMFDFALGLYKRMLEEVQQGVGITPLAESYKEFQQAPAHPKPMGWALRTTKKGARYNPNARKLVVDLFEDYYAHSKKLRGEEAERRMKERADILPSERMSLEQIKNCIRSLCAAKKKEMENKGPKSRRRRALLDDMLKDFEEEDLPIEEEVDVVEDERDITADALFDMIHSDFSEFFEGSFDILDSNTFIDNIDS